MRQTHTYATLEVSRSAYAEMERLLRAAGYGHVFHDGVIDMQGIGLVQPPKSEAPMDVVCRICGDKIQLNKDSIETRAIRTDPLQQMKGHIKDKHMDAAIAYGFQWGFLFDMMCFACPDQPERFRESIVVLLDYFHKEPVPTTWAEAAGS